MNAQIETQPPISNSRELQLQLQGVDIQFGTHLALKQIDLNVYAGERVAFVGANGSGKSTLLRVIHGVLPFSSGQVHWQPGVQQAMVFQRPHMLRTSVINFVALALWLRGVPWRSAKEQALQALQQVDLQDLAQR